MPSWPETLHASQAPLQAEPQQRPSTQERPDWHSPVLLQAAPCMPDDWHWLPALQKVPVASHSGAVVVPGIEQLVPQVGVGCVTAEVQTMSLYAPHVFAVVPAHPESSSTAVLPSWQMLFVQTGSYRLPWHCVGLRQNGAMP